jgi:hypothetical protein
MSAARVPSAGLRGGSDDEDDRVVIGVNEWVEGSKWEPPGGLTFKDFASAQVAAKFAEKGGALTFYTRDSDSRRLVFRCTTIPPKSVEAKVQKESKKMNFDHNKFSLKDETTCKFVIRFAYHNAVTGKRGSGNKSGWYLKELCGEHSEGCLKPTRKRSIKASAISAIDNDVLQSHVPNPVVGRGQATQLYRALEMNEGGTGGSNFHTTKSQVRKYVESKALGGQFDHLTNMTKLVSLVEHARMHDKDGVYVVETSPLTYNIPGVKKCVHPTLRQILLSPNSLHSRVVFPAFFESHSPSRDDEARVVDFVFFMPSAAIKFCQHAGS